MLPEACSPETRPGTSQEAWEFTGASKGKNVGPTEAGKRRVKNGVDSAWILRGFCVEKKLGQRVLSFRKTIQICGT